MLVYTLNPDGTLTGHARTHRAKITTPETDITISKDGEGHLILIATHGRLVIEPQASNAIKLRTKNP